MTAEERSFGGVGQPASHAEQVTPSNSEDLIAVSRAFYIGGAGNMSVVMQGGETVLFSGLLAGSILPIRASRVRSTLTTATLIVNLY